MRFWHLQTDAVRGRFSFFLTQVLDKRFEFLWQEKVDPFLQKSAIELAKTLPNKPAQSIKTDEVCSFLRQPLELHYEISQLQWLKFKIKFPSYELFIYYLSSCQVSIDAGAAKRRCACWRNNSSAQSGSNETQFSLGYPSVLCHDGYFWLCFFRYFVDPCCL